MSSKVQGHTARKRFGQNFLHDTHIIEQIVHAVSPKLGEHIVEIGPGLGAITEPLLKAVDAVDGHLTAVELDRDLASRLRLNVGALDNQNLSIIETSALKYDFSELVKRGDDNEQAEAGKLRVVGNLPYNISTPILFHLMSFKGLIGDMHFMLQKEVVERIVAPPNSKTYGRLSVMMQYHAKASHLFDVPRGAFNPAPKVTSAVFRLEPYETKPIQATDETCFAHSVREAFNQRRKTLRAIFKKKLTAEQIQAAGLDPMARPETLSVADFVGLSNAIKAAENAQS